MRMLFYSDKSGKEEPDMHINIRNQRVGQYGDVSIPDSPLLVTVLVR